MSLEVLYLWHSLLSQMLDRNDAYRVLLHTERKDVYCKCAQYLKILQELKTLEVCWYRKIVNDQVE